MMMETKILKFLDGVSPLSEKDSADILTIIKTKQLKKGEYWLEEGRTNYRIAFIEEGYLRKYYVKDGNEITDAFYFENDICADLPSIIGKTTSLANSVAMQDTVLTAFSYAEFNQLCER